MTEKEKTAPNELAATSSEQSSTDKSIITNDDKKVKWLSDEKKIDEPLFCKNFCERSELRYIDGQFYSIDGMENHTKIRSEIARLLEANGVTSGIAKKTNSLFDALALFCHSAPIKPRDDEIHVLNGVIKVDGKIGEPPTFIPEKRFCVNRLCVEYDPDIWKHCYYPGHFMDFLCGLLELDDIMTLQEYLGYCMIPSTKGQAALFIIGNGGEGKSRIGVMIKDLFGSSVHSDSFQRIENDKFERYNLMNKLVLYDDDMQLEALKSTGYIKNIITTEIPVDVEAKGKQSQQAHLYCRLVCVGNGSPKALYDKSDGFARRLIILSVKPKPRNRIDDPNLSEMFRKELLQIFCWALDGLRRLIENNYKFTISEKTKANNEGAVAENCNVIDFMNEAVQFRSGYAISNSNLYLVYTEWCEENALTALKRETFVRWVCNNTNKYNIKYTTHIKAGNKEVRGFEGMCIKNQ